MTLPVTNLDDRNFQDIVDEAKRLIPTFCPEWTNHNLSDPGVALIELFAWMTEMSLFRLNQVPDVFYTRMLNLVGFEPFPATAARADITFWLTTALDEPVVVPAETEVATAGDIGETRVFSTLDDLVIAPPRVIAALTSIGADTYADVWDDLRIDQGAVACFRTVTPGDAFYLGFENTLAGVALRLQIDANVEGIGVLPDRPPMRWEVWQGEGWIPVRSYRDSTGGLNRNGNVVLLVPGQHEPLTLGGRRAFWLRARLLVAEPGQPT
ncbi:MAG TPA: putative baseplate assembly protein, partial [Ilumatobacteraceae bacterium]|nr:putative baseplate assembly protein [Ilumatobacteraceae bacterium]